jgi:hydroxymethylglutaryl-CoA lyase
MTRIYFNDVVTRDGFQIEPNFIPTDDKVKLVDELSECGFAKIEVTSFTSPKAIPMLRDAEEVMGRIKRVPGVEYTVLVPNLRGAERALEAKADEFNLVMSTSETHNLANLRMGREKSFAGLAEVIRWQNANQCFAINLLWLPHGRRGSSGYCRSIRPAFCRSWG